MEYRLTTRGEADTARFGAKLAAHLQKGDTVFLYGDLGSGKSVLTRGVARALGVKETMASPTFTLMQPYENDPPLCHFDLYRLEDIDEFFAAGLSDYIGGEAISLIEWPLPEIEALPRVEARFQRKKDEEERSISLRFFGFDGREGACMESLSEWMDGT